jgi:plastocyanin
MRAIVVVIAAVIVAVALAAVLLVAPQRQAQPQPTTTTTLTTAAVTRPASPAREVIVVNPYGSSSDTSLSFQPAYVRVVIGLNNTVTWVNEDTTIHTVTSTERLFDYQLQPGLRISYTFTSPGVYRYTCSLHPWMAGVVEVAS